MAFGKYDYNEANREKAMRQKKQKIQGTIAVIITLAIVVGLTVAYYVVRARAMDALIGNAGNALTLEQDVVNARDLSVRGDFKDINMHASLYADGVQIGGMYEKNTFNPTLYITAGGELVYTIGPEKELTDELICVVYVFKDADGNILGYASENLPGGGFRILNADQSDTGIGIAKDGEWLLNPQGEKVVECDYWPGTWNTYDISADFSGTDVPAIYRVFQLYREYLYGYSYHSSYAED